MGLNTLQNCPILHKSASVMRAFKKCDGHKSPSLLNPADFHNAEFRADFSSTESGCNLR